MSKLIEILDKNFPKYDVTLKIMFVVKHSALRKILRIPFGQDLPQEFPDFEQTRVDALVFSNTKIFHVEFQAWNDPNMPRRMLDYRSSMLKWYRRIRRKRVSDIIQKVLYVGTPVMSMRNELNGSGLNFSYALHDIREFGPSWGRKLEMSRKPLNWILGLMCMQSVTADMWTEIAFRIRAYNGSQSMLPLPAILLVAATLRNVDYKLREEIVNMFSMNVENDPLFREVYLRGNERATKVALLKSIEEGLSARKIELTDLQNEAVVNLQISELLALTMTMMRPSASDDEIFAHFPSEDNENEKGMNI